ncbi:ABC transporter permease [Nakamurella sp. YIM 132087]|uniref:Autoinducer 2 import system permease protein LsrC n=1 Tax=Nakamurella alba TaxID=2665158 RepID=A0A7K1FQ74_9ACTN|nr:ABC transporter permease [Nakamurella alba]MTD16302.1 ABC transporter permease [Nakamurella alba]
MTAPARSPRPVPEASGPNRGQGLLRVRFLGVAVFLVLLWVVFAVSADNFLTAGNARAILFAAAVLTIAAAGEAMVVLTGNLDLSVGSVMGLSAYVTADISTHVDGGPLLVLVAVAIGAVLGLLNGALVALLQIPSIVATLGTLSVYRGLTYVYADGQQITSNEVPSWFGALAGGSVAGIPNLVLLALLVVIGAAAALRWTVPGRMLYAVGSNSDAARFFGLPSVRVVWSSYIVAGAIAGFAGFLYAAQVGTVTVVLASGWELQVLAAAVIGGVSIWGGSGSIVGVALGAVVLATIQNGLILLGVQAYWQLLIQGAAIVLAVAVDAAITRRAALLSRTRRRVAVTA